MITHQPSTTTTTTSKGPIEMNAYAQLTDQATRNGWTAVDYYRDDSDHVAATRFTRGTDLSVLVDWSLTGTVVDAVALGSTLGRREVTSRDTNKRTRVLAWLGTMARRQDRETIEAAHAEALEINRPYRVAAPNGWYSLERRNAPRNADGSLVRPSVVDISNALDRAMAPAPVRPSVVDISNALDRAMAPIVRTGRDIHTARISPALAHQALVSVTGGNVARWER